MSPGEVSAVVSLALAVGGVGWALGIIIHERQVGRAFTWEPGLSHPLVRALLILSTGLLVCTKPLAAAIDATCVSP